MHGEFAKMIPLNKLLALKFPNADFYKDILLADYRDGKGIVIQKWNLDVPLPTDTDIQQWQIDFDLAYRQQEAVANRRYPSIGDQLDMLYKDLKNGTKTWITALDTIKTTNPKPMV